MRSLILACAILPFVATCARQRPAKQAHSPPPDWLIDYVGRNDSELAVVDPSNGIDANEATRIADVYMVKYIMGCGGADIDLGVMTIAEALRRASDAGLKLVEVIIGSDPAVCRMMNAEQFDFYLHATQRSAN